MASLLVTSLSSGAGKTALSTGIAKQFQAQGKKVGYLRPVIGAPPTGGDAFFMKEILGLLEPLETLCPAFTNENQFTAGIKQAFDAVAAGKDIIIIECASAGAARTLGAKVILIATYSDLTDSRLANAYRTYGQQGIGVVINKVPVSRIAGIRDTLKANFNKLGVPLTGVLPEDRLLMTFTIAELAKAIDGEILNNVAQIDALPVNFMLGAMTADSGLPYFNRMSDKVAILRSERPDMQMAALETSTRAVVVSGAAPLIPNVTKRAESQGVPFIRTKLDCASIAVHIEDTLVRARFHQKSKVARIAELMSQGFDFAALGKAVGV